MFALTKNTGLKCIDRGDVSTPDFLIWDFITDGTWYDLDLSSIIGKDVKIVIIHLSAGSSVAGFSVRFRPKGYTYSLNAAAIYTQVADMPFEADLVVVPDSDGVIQYCIEDASWTPFSVVIRLYLV